VKSSHAKAFLADECDTDPDYNLSLWPIAQSKMSQIPKAVMLNKQQDYLGLLEHRSKEQMLPWSVKTAYQTQHNKPGNKTWSDFAQNPKYINYIFQFPISKYSKMYLQQQAFVINLL